MTIATKLAEDALLETNARLDPKRIAEFEAFQARMEGAGMTTKTRYLVEPSLGRLPSTFQRR